MARPGSGSLMVAEDAQPSVLNFVARSLFLDLRARGAIEFLRAAGIPAILLKGAAIATWLYNDGTLRPYADIDLLVSPADFDRAVKVLAELGYRLRLAGAHPAELGPKEMELIGPQGVNIDLHHGLLGASAPTQVTWNVLSARTVTMPLAGGEVQVLDIPARALHLALHVAQNGPIDVKAVNDLTRGIQVVTRAQWRDAAVLAQEIGATATLGAGLRLVPAGVALAAELELPNQMSVELALRTLSVTQDALFFARFSETRGAGRRARLLVRKVFPTATTLRANSAMARNGRLGLLRARAAHPFALARRFRPAFTAWYRVRRSPVTTPPGTRPPRDKA